MLGLISGSRCSVNEPRSFPGTGEWRQLSLRLCSTFGHIWVIPKILKNNLQCKLELPRCLLYYLAKLTVVFTCISLNLNLYTSIFGCGYGFGFEQKFWRIDGFGEKKARIGGFAYPYSPPSINKRNTTTNS